MKPRPIIHRLHDRQLGHWGEEIAGGLETAAKLSRRRLLTGTAAVLGALLLTPPTRLLAQTAATMTNERSGAVKTGKLIFPRLQFNVIDPTYKFWNIGPSGDVKLRQQLKKLTNINVSNEPKVVRLSEMDDMCRHPFVFMTSAGSFQLPQVEEENMREYLDRGGFVLADDCMWEGSGDKDRFFQSYLKLMGKLYPDNPIREIPVDHEVFHTYYDFPKGCPHMQGKFYKTSNAAGLFEPGTGRLMTFASPGDLHCGWMCEYWPEAKNMESIKMGINVLIYFLSH